MLLLFLVIFKGPERQWFIWMLERYFLQLWWKHGYRYGNPVEKDIRKWVIFSHLHRGELIIVIMHLEHIANNFGFLPGCAF